MPIQNPLPPWPPRPPAEPDSAPRPSSRQVSRPQERNITYNANGALIPIAYGTLKLPGLFTYRTRSSTWLVLSYIWCLGGDEGIDVINEIIINDVLRLDVSDTGHGQTKYFSSSRGGIRVTNYYGLSTQPVDTWLSGGYDTPGFDENFTVKGNDGSTIGVAYSVISIPISSTFVNDEGAIVELKGYPTSVKAIGEWMKIQSIDSNGFTGTHDSRRNPIYQISDFIASPSYGLNRQIDFASADLVRINNSIALSYEDSGGTSTVLRNRASFVLDQRLDLTQLFTLFEDISECWINDDGETVSFIVDKARTTDLTVDYADGDFVDAPQVTSSRLSNIPNKVTVNYSDANYDYQERPVIVTTPGADTYSVRIKESVLNRPWIDEDHTAKRYAIKAFNKARLEFIRFRYTVTDIAQQVKRGHVHELTHPVRGLESTKVRVLNIDWAGGGDYIIDAELYDERVYSNVVHFSPSEDTPPVNLVDPPELMGLSAQEVIKTINNKNVSRVEVSWTASTWEGLIGYVIEYWQGGVQLDQIFLPIIETHTLSTYDDNIPLLIRVRIRGEYALGPWAEKEITPQGTYAVPSAPENYTATALSNSVFLQWDRVVDVGIVQYEIRRYTTPGNYLTGTYVDRILGTQLVLTNVPDGTWVFGLAAVDEVEQYSSVVEQTVTIDFDDDVNLQTTHQFTDWDYSVPAITYDETLGEPRQLIGGTVGMRALATGVLMSCHGAIHSSDDTSTVSSPLAWTDYFSGAMSSYSGSILSNMINPNFLPDGDFADPGEWTLQSGWSIATGKLIATNVNVDNSAVAVMDYTVPANSFVQFRHQIVANTYDGGDFKVYINGTTVSHKNLLQTVGTTATFQLKTTSSGTAYWIRGANSLDVDLELARVHYTPSRCTTETLDLGGIISARFFVAVEAAKILVARGTVEYIVETSTDNTNWTQHTSGSPVARARYVRVLIRSVDSDRDCSFKVDITGVSLKIRASQIRDSGVAIWNTLPDVTTALTFLPATLGESFVDRAHLRYAPVATTDVDTVGDSSERSFFMQFITGNEITTRQVVFTMGSRSVVSVYIDSGELVITARFKDSDTTVVVPIVYSRQTVKPETFYTVGITFDFTTSKEFLTFINGKRAIERPEFIAESIKMPDSYYAFRDPSSQNLEPQIKLGAGKSTPSELHFIVEPDGTIDSTRGYAFRGTLIRYVQWDGLVTESEMAAFYEDPWHIDPADYETVVLDCKPGDVNTSTGNTTDHSGTGRVMVVQGPTNPDPFLPWIDVQDALLPVVAKLNKQFIKLFSVNALIDLGPQYEVIIGNIELSCCEDDTIEFHVLGRNTFEPAFKDVTWKVEGI